ncbi:hypothetical protein FA95DRAFT_1500221, partial [Auriscalpium vulgare]
TCLVLDCEKRIIAVLLGRPKDGNRESEETRWDPAMSRLADLFEETRVFGERKGVFTPEKVETNPRGRFVPLTFGVSYGGGATAPGTLAHGVTEQEMVNAMREVVDLRRVAKHQSEGLACFFPKAYDHMRLALEELYKRYPEIEPNFGCSAYPAATANLGPGTTCFPHKDTQNYPGLACAVTAFGNFDHKCGGHMLFWDLKLKVEFPSGATILLSSAGLCHGNLPVQDGERRYSFTQYCSGGLLRWVRHGFRPAGTLSKTERVHLDGLGDAGWKAQLDRLSKYDELEADRKWLLEREKERLSGSA